MTENANKSQLTLTPLQKAFLAIEKLQAKLKSCEEQAQEPIAIVGMGCRFPGGGNNPEQFWELLEKGTDTVSEISAQRWSHQQYYHPDPANPGTTYVDQAAFISQPGEFDVDGFDAEFFGIPPREAKYLDPQHRLLLELAWEALEHAGVAPRSLKDSNAGVFIGIGQNDYLHILRESANMAAEELYTGTGNGFCFASGRLSYLLGTQGPSFSVDTACSSSLVALHQACLSLRAKECEIALCGGVQLILSPAAFILMSGSQALAKDGRCKTFDSRADGYGRGEGGGMVVLKRLSDAQREGDHILAVINGSVVNHDGKSSGLTVPNGQVQVKLLEQLLATAQVPAEQISYVETHGTGTPLGDPIECRALGQVLRKDSETPLLLGAVKSNIGHLEAAAGMAGLIKLVLSLQNGRIPASLHYEHPNPAIPWQDYPFQVVEQLMDWPQNQAPRTGLVSSFGLSGTNSQVIVSEAPPSVVNEIPGATESSRDVSDTASKYLFKLSAKNKKALFDWAQSHQQYLDGEGAEQALADICFRANQARDDYQWRVATSVSTHAELRSFLSSLPSIHDNYLKVRRQRQQPVFLFSGQGSMVENAGIDLYRNPGVFRDSLLACEPYLQEYAQLGIEELLFSERSPQYLAETQYEQIGLFVLQYALASQWIAWGIKPAALMGHSVGEYAAACIAGVFELQDGIRLICERGRLMQSLAQDGAMLAVFFKPDDILNFLLENDLELEIAAVNAAQQVVLSGQSDVVEKAIGLFEQKRIDYHLLKVKRAFHSRWVEPLLQPFRNHLQSVVLKMPRFPIVSTVTGKVEREALTSVDYWLQHTRQAVQFKDALDVALEQGHALFLEMGARPILSRLTPHIAAEHNRSIDTAKYMVQAFNSLGEVDKSDIYQTVARLYQAGCELDWPAFYQGQNLVHNRVTLPSYPWQRKRYWISAPKQPSQRLNMGAQTLSEIHPFVDHCIQSPLLHSHLYQGWIDCQKLPFLLDHKVFDKIVVAGACHISTALAIGKSRFDSAFELRHIEFVEPITLNEGQQRELHMGLSPSETNNHFALTVVSMAPGQAENAIEHAHLNLAPLDLNEVAGLKAPSQLEQVQEQLATASDVAAFYQVLSQQNVQLGDSFRWLQELYQGERQALAKMRVASSQEQLFGVPPGLIDACFQVLGAAIDSQYTDTFIPVAVEQISFVGFAPVGAIWCYAQLDRQPGHEGMAYGEVELFDEDGLRLLLISGISMRRTDQTALQSVLSTDSEPMSDSHFAAWHEIKWQTAVAISNTTVKSSSKKWLLLGNNWAKRVAQKNTHESEQIIYQDWQMEMQAIPEGIAGVVLFLEHNDGVTSSQNNADDCAEDNPGDDAIDSAKYFPQIAEQQLNRLIQVLQQGIFREEDEPLSYYIVSHQAQAVELHSQEEPEVGDPSLALVNGLIKSFRNENPDISCRWLDVDGEELSLASVFATFDAYPQEMELALRAEKVYVPRLQKFAPQDLGQKQQNAPVLSGTYLITGGNGALGQHSMEWLINYGVKRFLMLSRRPLDTEQTEKYSAYAQQGIEVIGVQADVADRQSLQSVFQQYGSEIGGIVHAAGVLDDGIFSALGRDSLAKVLAPKLTGCVNLHELSQIYSSDPQALRFISFSSIASLLGSAGQASYSAANAFMDYFMRWRQAQGLHGLSINWGPWAGAGMATIQSDQNADIDSEHEQHSKRQLAELGIRKIQPQEAFLGIAEILNEPIGQLGIFHVDWQQGKIAGGQFIEDLVQGEGRQAYGAHKTSADSFANPDSWSKAESKAESNGDKQKTIQQQLADIPRSQRGQLLQNFLTQQVRAVMGMDVQDMIAADANFTDLGMDSLMAVELKNRLQKMFPENRFSSTLAFKYPSLEELCDYLQQNPLKQYFAEESTEESSPDAEHAGLESESATMNLDSKDIDSNRESEPEADIEDLLEQALLELDEEES